MIKLTAPNGMKLEIDPSKISLIKPNDGQYSPAAKTVIRVDGENHAVLETLAEIDKLKATDHG